MNTDYKYLKYKTKYLALKTQTAMTGGNIFETLKKLLEPKKANEDAVAKKAKEIAAAEKEEIAAAKKAEEDADEAAKKAKEAASAKKADADEPTELYDYDERLETILKLVYESRVNISEYEEQLFTKLPGLKQLSKKYPNEPLWYIISQHYQEFYDSCDSCRKQLYQALLEIVPEKEEEK